MSMTMAGDSLLHGIPSPASTSSSQVLSISRSTRNRTKMLKNRSNELELGRLIVSVFQTVLLHAAFILVTTTFLGYPDSDKESESDSFLGWCLSFFIQFLSFSFLMVFLTTAGISALYLWNTEWTSYQPTSKWNAVKHLVTVKNAVSSAVLGFLGVLIIRVYFSFANLEVGRVIYPCSTYNTGVIPKTYCVNERNFFLQWNVFAMGLLFSWICAVERRFVVRLPTLYRPNLERLRLFYMNYFGKSFWKTTRLLPLCYGSYFIIGKSLFSGILFLSSGANHEEQIQWFHYLSPTLFIQSLLLCFATDIFLATNLKLFQYSVVEPASFPIDSLFPAENTVLLGSALKSQDPYLKLLGFQDLRLLCVSDSQNIRKLFTLSHPGGNPLVWNEVCGACLDSMKTTEKSLLALLEKDVPKAAKSEPVAATPCLTGCKTSHGRFSLVSKPSEKSDIKIYNRNRLSMRSLSPKYEASNVKTSNSSPVQSFFEKPSIAFVNMKNKITFFQSQVKPAFAFPVIWTSIVDTDTQSQLFNILDNSTMVVLIMQNLTEIACLSLTLDSSGVVQKDLGTIIDQFLTFFNTLERCRNEILKPERVQGRLFHANRRKMHQLSNCIRFCLSRIYFNFSTHFDVLSVPEYNQTKLRRIVKA